MEWIRCVFREGYAMVSRVIFILLFLLFIIYVHTKKLIHTLCFYHFRLFQQGLTMSTFYHFYAHDVDGVIGVTLRSGMKPVAVKLMLLLGANEKESEDDALFAKFAIGVLMVIMAILRMPQVWGAKYSPFTSGLNVVKKALGGKKKKVDSKPPSSPKKSPKKSGKKNQ